MNSLSQESRFNVLCYLYSKYASIVKDTNDIISPKQIQSTKIDELNKIIQEVENFPISWRFYKKQVTQFPQEFEDLIVFHDETID